MHASSDGGHLISIIMGDFYTVDTYYYISRRVHAFYKGGTDGTIRYLVATSYALRNLQRAGFVSWPLTQLARLSREKFSLSRLVQQNQFWMEKEMQDDVLIRALVVLVFLLLLVGILCKKKKALYSRIGNLYRVKMPRFHRLIVAGSHPEWSSRRPPSKRKKRALESGPYLEFKFPFFPPYIY